jgi:hypothetical protein
MKQHRLKVGTLIFALGTASLCAQDLQTRPPPYPPKPLDAKTHAAHRAILMNRAANLSQAAQAAAATNGLAQGAPGRNNGVDSGGQTNAAGPGIEGGKVPIVSVSGPAGIGAAISVGASPAVGATGSPAPASGIK